MKAWWIINWENLISWLLARKVFMMVWLGISYWAGIDSGWNVPYILQPNHKGSINHWKGNYDGVVWYFIVYFILCQSFQHAPKYLTVFFFFCFVFFLGGGEGGGWTQVCLIPKMIRRMSVSRQILKWVWAWQAIINTRDIIWKWLLVWDCYTFISYLNIITLNHNVYKNSNVCHIKTIWLVTKYFQHVCLYMKLIMMHC